MTGEGVGVPAGQILEALDLSAEDPSHRFLERLFTRFNARVPFETVSKILRDADVAEPAEKPGSPELFWEQHLSWGAGGTCFARVAGFEALLQELGFRVEKLLGRVEIDFDHAALRVHTERGPVLADVGFPLQVLLPEAEGETETPLTGLRVVPSERGWNVFFTAGVPIGPPGVEIFGEPVRANEFIERWRSTFRADSRFLAGVSVRRTEEHRVVSFMRGEVKVEDRHSLLAVPLPPPRAARVAELFDIDETAVQRALALTHDLPSALPGAVLTVYLATDVSPEAAFAAVGTSDAYRRLMSGVAGVASCAATPVGWRLELRAPGEGSVGGPAGGDSKFVEEVIADAGLRRLAVRRIYPDRAYESFFEARELRGRTYLMRAVAFEGSREDLLRNDSARGRMAGTLAVDLLAWSRLVGRG